MPESRFDIVKVKDDYYYITSRERENEYKTLVFPCTRYGEVINKDKIILSRNYPNENAMLLGHKVLTHRLKYYIGGVLYEKD